MVAWRLRVDSGRVFPGCGAAGKLSWCVAGPRCDCWTLNDSSGVPVVRSLEQEMVQRCFELGTRR